MTVRHVSLLRGINVGGHNLVSMARLRALYEALGCEEVATYLQSGNVVFRRDRDPAGVGRRRRTGDQARARPRGARARPDPRRPRRDRRGRPVPRRRPEPAVRDVPVRGARDARSRARSSTCELGPDESRLIGREIHLDCPDGLGNSKLPGLLSETPARGDRDHAELADGQPAAGALGRLGLSRRSVTRGRPAAASR